MGNVAFEEFLTLDWHLRDSFTTHIVIPLDDFLFRLGLGMLGNSSSDFLFTGPGEEEVTEVICSNFGETLKKLSKGKSKWYASLVPAIFARHLSSIRPATT